MQGKLHFLRAYIYCWKCFQCLHYLASKISAVYLDDLWKKYLLFVFATMPTNAIFQWCLQTSFSASSCLGRKHEQSVPRHPFNPTHVFPHLIAAHESRLKNKLAYPSNRHHAKHLNRTFETLNIPFPPTLSWLKWLFGSNKAFCHCVVAFPGLHILVKPAGQERKGAPRAHASHSGIACDFICPDWITSFSAEADPTGWQDLRPLPVLLADLMVLGLQTT